MRSIHTIKSGNREKKDYYTKDESLRKSKDQKAYYSAGEGEAQGKTEAIWFGKDAERLNLRGHGLDSDWEQIFDGFIPGTDQRIRGEVPREDHQENCIYDVVLSCKKSVSMQIHLGQDERLYKAYQDCVREVAELIEHDYAQARIQTNGDRRIVQTEGIIALMIPHHASRELDMHVHTHLAIANGTYCEDGKWRSLLDRGFSHAYYMGDYFSARLAARVQALGYEIRETVTEEGHPSWELAGFTDEQIKVFSKRSEDAKVKELVAAGVSRDDALMRTRKAKNAEETLEEAKGRWKVEADAFEIEAITPLNRPVMPKYRATAEEVLESAIRHYSNRSNHFTRDQIREYAFKLNRTFTVEDLDRAIAPHPSLIDYGKLRGVDELVGYFTTAEAAEREIHTIKAWMQGKEQATPILDRLTATLALERIELKTGQRAAIIGVLASNNQHQIIHGLSGVGKTTALRQLKVLTDREQVEVMGFAPSIDAAKKLSTELGIETHTVQGLVKKNFDLKPNQLLIIDEAGMVSAEMMDVVMRKANAARARVLLVGDTGQNQAIEAGSPMRSLMKHGAEVHHIAEIIRQQNSIQRQAVELIAKGRGLDALSLLNEHDYINPIEDRGQRVSALAAEFLALSPEEQLNTLIVAGTNVEKDAITAEIRAGLKAEGRLGESRSVVQLRDRALTPEEARQIAYYRVGDYIKFTRTYKRISERDYENTWLQKNVPYKVVAKEDNELVVATVGGRRFRVNPALMKDKQVFEGHEFDIAVGDSLRWTSSNQEKGQINGKTFKITAINGDVATILTDDGLRQLDLREALAVDYTLTSTSYRAQGSDRPRVFVCATNDPTSNREPFYVSISRQIKELKVWTDDYDDLKRRVAESSVQINPLELLGENYVRQNSSSESRERSTQGDTISESSRPDHRNVGGESIDSRVIDRRDSRFSREDPERSRDALEQAQGGREQDLRSNWELVTLNRPTEQTSRREPESPEISYSLADGEQQEVGQAVGERLIELTYRNRLANELSEPLARLISTLAELRKVEELNLSLQAEIAQQTELVLNQAKVEILDTALEEWRSLTQEPALALPELSEAITPSDVAELTSLIEHFPAQKVIEFAMEDFYHATNLVIDTKSTQKLGSPVFRGEDTMPTKTVEPPKKRQTAAPGKSTAPPPNKRTRSPVRSIPKPVKPEPPFWVPDYTDVIRPEQIEPHHWQEMVNSAIHPDLIRDNVRSLEGESVYEYLLSARLATMGTGQIVTRPMARLMAQYESLTEGGWWGEAGADALSLVDLVPGQKPIQSDWGTFKGDNPRIDQDKTSRRGEPQSIKYEHPAGIGRHLYLVNVSNALAQKIYAKHGIKPTELEKQTGFWSVVKAYPEIPINLGEGFKKTASAISQGDVQIGSSGVNGFYRARDAQGNKLPERVLNDELAVFAVPGRVFRFTFDQDTKASTVKAVRRDMVRTIELLEARGCICLVAKWNPNQGKGLDDLIANQGPQAYAKAIITAQPAEHQKQIHYRTEFNVIARQVRKTQPDISGEALDVEVYLRAVAKGEAKDGDHFLSQSDQARSLKDPDEVAAYIEHIKAIAPHYHQRLREQAALQAQQAQDRSEYIALSQRIKQSPVEVSSQVVDMQVYLIAEREGNPGDGDRLLAQSDTARSLTNEQEVLAYVEQIKTEAPLWFQRSIETARANSNRATYEVLMAEVTQAFGDIPPEQRDMEICLLATAKDLDVEAILSQGDHARSLYDPDQVRQYLTRIQAEAPHYRQRDIDQHNAEDRTAYQELSQQVTADYGYLSPEVLDTEVYLRAAAKGLDPNAILAQSDQVRSLNTPDEVKAYTELVQTTVALYHEKQAQEKLSQEAWARDRSAYQALALEVTQALGKIPTQQLDTEIYLRAIEQGKEPECILIQSDYALSLRTDYQAADYVDRIVQGAPQYRQKQAQAEQQAAQVAAQKQLTADRSTYLHLQQQVRNQVVVIEPHLIDAVVYKWAQAQGLDGDRILAQSDRLRAQQTPQKKDDYVHQAKAMARRVSYEQGPDVSAQQRELNESALKSCMWVTERLGIRQPDGAKKVEGKQYQIYAKQGEYRIYSIKEKRNVLELKNGCLTGTVSAKFIQQLEKGKQNSEKVAENEAHRAAQKRILEKTQAKQRDNGFER